MLETLSQWVPEGVTLLVKENPAQNSVMRGKFFFERLRRLQNIRVVPIETSTYDLIEKAAAGRHHHRHSRLGSALHGEARARHGDSLVSGAGPARSISPQISITSRSSGTSSARSS